MIKAPKLAVGFLCLSSVFLLWSNRELNTFLSPRISNEKIKYINNTTNFTSVPSAADADSPSSRPVHDRTTAAAPYSSSPPSTARCRISYYNGSTRVRRKDLLTPDEGDWSFRREVNCDHSGVGEGEKGRALVLYMVSGEWNSTHANRLNENTNFRFFLHVGYVGPNISTKLFSGVDFVVYRRAEVENVTEMPYESCGYSTPRIEEVNLSASNVRIIFVPMTVRCDLCGHGLILKHLNYEERTRDGTWPYRSVIGLNSGSRGPFISKQEHLATVTSIANGERDITSWVDIASIGEGERPLHMTDEIEEHWTTVTGFSIAHHLGHAHLQSIFLSIPVASLPFYYKLFLHNGCTSFDPAWGPPNTKVQCIIMCELRQSEFLNATTNGLLPKNPAKVRSLGVDRDPSQERLTRVDGVTNFTSEDEKSRYRFWQIGMSRSIPGGFYHLGMPSNIPLTRGWDEPFNHLFIKFGGVLFSYLPKEAISEIERLTQNLMRLTKVHEAPSSLHNILFSVRLEEKTEKLCSLWEWGLLKSRE